MKNIQKLIVLATISLILPNTVFAVEKGAATISDLEVVFSNIVTSAGVLIGFAFFIMLIIGGIRYLLSGGDPKALQAAKGTITWAIVGLAIFVLSFTILLLVKAFTGVDVTIFKLSTT